MKILNFFKKTKEEMTHVVWPTRKQTVTYTVLILVITVIVAYMLGFFDFIFTNGLEQLL
jgi:preprotein translocase SecE subunit